MIKELKSFICDYDTTPSKEDIEKCCQIARENDCCVSIEWTLKWSGHFQRIIRPETDSEEMYNNISNIVYGL